MSLYLANEAVYDKRRIAEGAAAHFATIGTKLCDRIAKRNDDNPNKHSTIRTNQNSIFLRQATEEEDRGIISVLDAKKASGIDGIDAAILKHCAIEISPILASLINLCMHIQRTIPRPTEDRKSEGHPQKWTK